LDSVICKSILREVMDNYQKESS